MKKSIFLTLCAVPFSLFLTAACQTIKTGNANVTVSSPNNSNNVAVLTNPLGNSNPTTAENPTQTNSDAPGSSPEKPIEINRPTIEYDGSTPTKAYKSLYAAVKSGDANKVRGHLSIGSLAFAEYIAGMQKKTPEEVSKNGFFEANLSPNLPALRDERIEGDFAAVEARLPSGKWEVIPMIKEDGKWRIAVGEMFSGNFKMSSKSKSQIEAENANSKGGGMIPMTVVNTNANANANINSANPTHNSNAAPPSGEGKNKRGVKTLGVPQN